MQEVPSLVSGLYKKVREKAFIEFSRNIEENVRVINHKQADFDLSEGYVEIWEIETGLYDEENSKWLVEELTMYIAFDQKFPLTIPKVFYSKSDFSKIGHIPHTSYKLNDICTLDNFVIVDESNPTGIIEHIYELSKKTLIDGIKGKNEADFTKEFIAYWESVSDEKDKLSSKTYYSLIDNAPKNNDSIKILFYTTYLSNKKTQTGILFNNDEELIKPYIKYFENLKVEQEIVDTFYIGNNYSIDKPPFTINCYDSLRFISEVNEQDFKKYFNGNSPKKHIIFKKNIDGENYYLGWEYPTVTLVKNGFRPGSISYYDATFNKMHEGHKKYVNRISTQKLNEKRLIARTSTNKISNPKYKFLIGGVGSVGSFLLAQLNSINTPDFTLIDNDILKAENIKRHLLGFKHIGQNKADAIKMFLKDKFPSQKVEAVNNSIFNYYAENQTIFNEQDYIFLCLGKLNLEKWFIEQLANGGLKKPVFIIWVEPYLLGGQLLYLHPNDVPDINFLFPDIYKYRYSVISPEEFELKREILTLKESGCQTTYSPYSSVHLSLFISSIYVKIFSIINDAEEKSSFYTWIGDIQMAKDLIISLRDDNFQKFTIIKNEE